MGFNANEHLTSLKGKAYLEIKWRLVWFREEHPDWSIETKPLLLEDKKAVFCAYVKDDQGRVLAMGTKSETPAGFADFIEKAETGSVGRALAHLGYGTQFAPELEEGERLADSPVERKPKGKPAPEDKPDWSAFKTAYESMGYTKEQVVKVAGTSKFDGWTKAEADELLAKLAEMKKEESA